MRLYPALDAWLTMLAVMGLSVLLATVVCVLGATCLSALGQRDRRGRGRESRHVLRMSRRFAELATIGDFEAAEAIIGKAVRSRVVGWDERVILDLPLDAARRELTETAAAATWFPAVRRTTRGDVVEVVMVGSEPIHLTVVSEDWTPQLDGMIFEAASGDFSIMGSLSLRAMVAAVEDSAIRTKIEVVVHMETTDVADARRALSRAQVITHDGLARMAATLNPR